MTGTWQDFNDAPDQTRPKPEERLTTNDLKERLHGRLREVLFHLLPNGKIRNGKFTVGDIQGNKGDSLCVELSGAKIGMWHDFATGDGGDILSLWGAVHGLDPRTRFPDIVSAVHEWLGEPLRPLPKVKTEEAEDLGPHTAKWDYTDAHGNLVACVYRYDTADGKEFRPWDVKARSLRSFYSTGMILFRPDEQQSLRQLMFELRNGEAIPPKWVDKIDGRWREMEHHSARLVNKDYGERLDNERRRRHDVILQLLFDEGRKGALYTPSQFCQAFENKAGLGGKHSIRDRIDVLATKGYVKFNKDAAAKSKYGVMCVEGSGSSPDGEEWQADVLCAANGCKIAFEVQLSSQTLEEYERRSEIYRKSGINPIWLVKNHSALVKAMCYRLLKQGKTVDELGTGHISTVPFVYLQIEKEEPFSLDKVRVTVGHHAQRLLKEFSVADCAVALATSPFDFQEVAHMSHDGKMRRYWQWQLSA